MKEHVFDFNPISRQEWLDKILKDLKGQAFEDLIWQLEPGISANPFHTKEDLIIPASPIYGEGENGSWHIGEDLYPENGETLDIRIQQSAKAGTEFPRILVQTVEEGNIPDVLEKLTSDAFSGAWIQDSKNQFSLDHLLRLLTAKMPSGPPAKRDYHLILEARPESNASSELSALFNKALQVFPNLKILVIPSSQEAEEWPVSKQLLHIVRTFLDRSQNLEHKGLTSKQIYRHTVLSVGIGTSYFVEIAKLRALRLIFGNLQKVEGLASPAPPFLDVFLFPGSLLNDPYSNMIRSTSMAMSAIIGGADRLSLSPADRTTDQKVAGSDRIARNVQYILRHESHFDKVVDPAAGSYYLEMLTRKFAENCWEQLSVSS